MLCYHKEASEDIPVDFFQYFIMINEEFNKFQVNFGYIEQGEKKNTLVKLSKSLLLCRDYYLVEMKHLSDASSFLALKLISALPSRTTLMFLL